MSSFLRRLLPPVKRYKEQTVAATQAPQPEPTNADEAAPNHSSSPVISTLAAAQPEPPDTEKEPTMSSGSPSRPPSPAREFPSSGFHNFAKSRKIDEENYSWFSHKEFYPVRIGQVIRDRYQVITKLGYGTSSTSWLCRDLKGHRYVAIKVYAANQGQAKREVAAFKHIQGVLNNTSATGCGGARFIRLLHKSFELDHPKSAKKNLCLVYEPMGMSLADLRRVACDGNVPLELLKPMLPYLLAAVDFMHTKANMVHTDIQEGNIMFSIEDEAELKEIEDDEMSTPSSRKVYKDEATFLTRQVFTEVGDPKLIDLGEARFGQKSYEEEVMPDLYRAPEILLGVPWDEKVDIWALGLTIWTCVEGENLFTDNSGGRFKSAVPHMARMISLLGPPPQSLLDKSPKANEFFDKHGQFKKSNKVKQTSLEQEEKLLEGEEKAEFLRFIRRMLQWDPASRPSAAELVSDPFLRADPDAQDEEGADGE
ncbi:hypothetical protein KVR01_013259 [Diaporthe batatas]|uniref:uncharacterized protein n=1 Tax=Diaporthe batatas TaxID=748121 RepID=UPI001D04B0A9|nr:uncharacterized protein KVR01_013259 [Diaporthe batatas]KAG8156846.1 hypothetical protein KVR01_013259 [Diaporthe batatas]